MITAPARRLLTAALAATALLTAAVAGADPPAPDPDAMTRLEGPHYLVWRVDPGGPRTLWLRATDAGYELVAQRQGVTVAGVAPHPDATVASSESALWQLEPGSQKAPLVDCECQEMDSFALCDPAHFTDAEVPTLDARRLDNGHRQRVFQMTSEPYTAELSGGLELVGSLGSVIYYIGSDYTFGCGAHGHSNAWFTAHDLATGAAIDVLKPTAALPEVRAARDALHQELAADRDASEYREDSPDAIDLVAIRPSFNEGQLSFSYLFAWPVCYACSGGDWASYTSSRLVELPVTPPPLAASATPPPAVARYLTAEPPSGAFGWSAVDPTSDDIARLQILFARP